MKEWIAVLRAADAVARWHVHQRRKGIAQEPYINHLLEVASLVSEATSGSDPTVLLQHCCTTPLRIRKCRSR
jgi:(p)ppGpp synthase/HD superfamily hydrolase